MGSAGCVVTSASMIANYYGSTKNPGQICAAASFTGDGALYWGSIPAAAGGTIQYAGNINYPGIPADMNKINSELDAGYPVIAAVNGYGHYIVITGHDGGTYYINDPGGPTIPYGRQGSFSTWYGSPVANYIDGIFMYHGTHTSPPPPASLAVSTPKSAFNTGEHVLVNWTAYPGATKYGLTVWKAPYTGDANVVWDNYVSGTSMDIGTLPSNSYRIHMAAYVGTTLVKLSNYSDFSVVPPPPPPPPPPAAAASVYRFRNLTNNFYLYSADPAERADINARLWRTWKEEGEAYSINPATNTSPLWRFRNLDNGCYLCLSDPVERADIKARLSAHWVEEGEAYKVSRSSVAGAKTVWRFRNRGNGTYLYSADPVERADINARLGASWKEEGEAYYLAP